MKLRTRYRMTLGTTFLASLLVAANAVATSSTISYQGILRDAALSVVPDDGYAMVFSIWDDSDGGDKQWGDESHPSVAVVGGLFTVYLGSILPFDTQFEDVSALWLEISADTGSGLETYAPRVPLASVPYAQYAKRADTASHADTAGDAETLEGQSASDFAEADHGHDGSDIISGTVPFLRLPVGTGANQVAAGNHTHPPNPAFNSSVGQTGWVRIGNLQIVWGQYSSGGTTTFPVSFSTTPRVICTARSGSNPRYVTVQTRSSTQFVAQTYTDSGGNSGNSGDYIAIGPF